MDRKYRRKIANAKWKLEKKLEDKKISWVDFWRNYNKNRV